MLISAKMPMNKIFLDTNVLIYAKDKSSSYHERSTKLLSQPFQFYTSSKNLSEYFAVVTRGEISVSNFPHRICNSFEMIRNYCIFTLFYSILFLYTIHLFYLSG